VPPGVRALQKDLESNFRAVLRASLTKLDLVSRDEFDAQMRVLERTRARLEELERRVAGMEGGGTPGAGGATTAASSGGSAVAGGAAGAGVTGSGVAGSGTAAADGSAAAGGPANTPGKSEAH
jgi:hypothetical protein